MSDWNWLAIADDTPAPPREEKDEASKQDFLILFGQLPPDEQDKLLDELESWIDEDE